MNDLQPPLRHHHPLRYIILIGFIAMVLISTDQAGQSEAVQRAAQNAALRSILAYSQTNESPEQSISATVEQEISPLEPIDTPDPATRGGHLPMPRPLHGIYLTGYTAGNPQKMAGIYRLFETYDLQAVVIDIKDATGKLSYQPLDPDLIATGVGTTKIRDLSGLIAELHEQGIYVIGRLQAFEDPYYVKLHPEDAWMDTRTGVPWHNYKGIAWLRPDRSAVWEYLAAIALDAYRQGFDEINLDYVRFPSDGELSFLDRSSLIGSRGETMETFFTYFQGVMKRENIPLSADLFGLVTSASDDLGIGQKLEPIAPLVDVVAPMVYPSHFASGAYGIADPAARPYEIIHGSLSRGVAKLAAVGIGAEKLRPWLQDFNLGAVYTADMVRAQIDAAKDVGIDDWVLWDPSNTYTEAALPLRE